MLQYICLRRPENLGNKLYNTKIMKISNCIYSAAIIFALASCAQGELPDFGPTTDDTQQTQEEIDNAEKIFGITLDPNQTWVTTTEKTLTFTGFPADIETEKVAIYTANPFTDTTAMYLTLQEEALETLTYELPYGYETLYAACIDANGIMRVKAFDVEEGTVDMRDNGITRSETPGRRAAGVIASKYDLTWRYTAHTTLGLPGWSDRYAFVDRGNERVEVRQIDECYKTALTWVPEGQNNIRKMLNYDQIYTFNNAIVNKDGGEVTVLPVYKNSSCHEYIGYFYEVPGRNTSFKGCDKYVFSEGILDNTNTATGNNEVNAYRLVYYDEDGNGSYQFPAGTRIHIFLCYREKYDHSCVCKDYSNWFSMGTLNVDMNEHKYDAHNINPNRTYGKDGWRDYSRVCYFNRNGINYVGCEDGTDFDLNDLLLTMQGDIEAFPDVATPTGNSLVYTYAFEDTKMGDYDMNDVVVQASLVTVRVNGQNEYAIRAKLMAVGANDELKLYYQDKTMDRPAAFFDGKELHEACGLTTTKEFVNTQERNVTKLPTSDVVIDKQFALKEISFAKADIFLYNVTKGWEIHLPAAQGLVGATPLAIALPGKWSWPYERVSVPNAYPEMAGFAEDITVNIDWYKHPKSKSVLYYE